MHEFEAYARGYIEGALRQITPEQASDIYVVSLFVYDEEDNPAYPTVTVGFNTETQVRAETPSAWDEAEARWNYAFWLQNDLGILGEAPRDAQGAALRNAWVQEIEPAAAALMDEDGPFPDDDLVVTDEFVEILVRTVQSLHADGVVEEIFGRPIPVLIHELEYYDEIVEQNRRANPDGLVEDFAASVYDED